MPIDRTRIEANGWSQGKFFRPEDSAKLFEQHAARVACRTTTPPDTLILASHDCDILSHIGDDEPDVTVFPVLPLVEGHSFSPVSVHRTARSSYSSPNISLRLRALPCRSIIPPLPF